MPKDFGSFFSRIKGRKVSFFGRIQSNFGFKMSLDVCTTVVQLGIVRLTVYGRAMATSRMVPSHFLWRKPYKCWDTVSHFGRIRLSKREKKMWEDSAKKSVNNQRTPVIYKIFSFLSHQFWHFKLLKFVTFLHIDLCMQEVVLWIFDEFWWAFSSWITNEGKAASPLLYH